MTQTNTMQFVETGTKKISSKAAKKHLTKDMDAISTAAIVWYLVVRHKFGLVMAWAVVMTINYFVPFAFDAVLIFLQGF